LIRALQDRTIAGAGLDLFWCEPPVTHDPFVPLALRKLDNVVLAPHNGGATWDSRGEQTSSIALIKLPVDPGVTRNTAAVVQQDWATELNIMGQGGPN
jgi:hypothetical protein